MLIFDFSALEFLLFFALENVWGDDTEGWVELRTDEEFTTAFNSKDGFGPEPKVPDYKINANRDKIIYTLNNDISYMAEKRGDKWFVGGKGIPEGVSAGFNRLISKIETPTPDPSSQNIVEGGGGTATVGDSFSPATQKGSSSPSPPTNEPGPPLPENPVLANDGGNEKNEKSYGKGMVCAFFESLRVLPGPFDGLLGNAINLCLPGLFYTIMEYGELHCEELLCRYNAFKSGLGYGTCSVDREYKLCSKILKEFQVLPILSSINLFGQLIQSTLANPFATGVGVGVMLAKIKLQSEEAKGLTACVDAVSPLYAAAAFTVLTADTINLAAFIVKMNEVDDAGKEIANELGVGSLIDLINGDAPKSACSQVLELKNGKEFNELLEIYMGKNSDGSLPSSNEEETTE